ncbi:MAG TPA: TetR/AcrR family transcriptional regulator [Mycobacteriales bacterium]
MTTIDPGRRKTGRLSADDWMVAALGIMATEGVAGVKILELCRRLGITKGSFYWHFADLDALLDAVAERWRKGHWAMPPGPDDERTPRQMLLDAMTAFVDPRVSGLDRSMREWARTDERARTAVAEADRLVFGLIVSFLEQLGFAAEEADVRAKLMFYSAIGFSAAGPVGSRRNIRRQMEATVDLLIARPG